MACIVLNLLVNLDGVSVDALRMPHNQEHRPVDKCLVGALSQQSRLCHIEGEDLLVLAVEVEERLENAYRDVGKQDQPHRPIEEPPVGETCLAQSKCGHKADEALEKAYGARESQLKPN